MSVLRACPWCNRAPDPVPQSTDTRRANGDGYTVAVWCEPCGVLGPECDTEAAAIATWNRRAPDYAAGAEAMREAAAGVLDAKIASTKKYQAVFERMGNDEAVRSRQIDIENYDRAAAAIRALPLPEPPK